MKMSFPIISEEEGTDIEAKVVELLVKRGHTITTAESCTGGLVAGRLVNVPGASKVFHRGFVTYSNQAKAEELGVKKSTLKKYGAVSKQTVKQMARGAARHGKTDVAIAVTGLAGPDGGTPEQPVGLVYIGIYYLGRVYWQKCHFSGTRMQIRQAAVVNSLYFLVALSSCNPETKGV